MRYIVFDFETTGVGKDASNRYKPYTASKMPLPVKNYPVELAAVLLDNDGTILDRLSVIIKGAQRLDPWVLQNCPHLSIGRCDKEGVDFAEALGMLAELVTDPRDEGTMLVAHNMHYDWDDVILHTVEELQLKESKAFLKLSNCTRLCTMVNPDTKKQGTSYFYKRINKWIGPSLCNLAHHFHVKYDTTLAHGAMYDAMVTAECLCHYKGIFFGVPSTTLQALEETAPPVKRPRVN